MRKTLSIFAGFSVATLVLIFWFGGNNEEIAAFTVGFGIFAANLALWTVIVRELLENAAHTSRALQQAALDRSTNKEPGLNVSDDGPLDSDSLDTGSNGPEPRRGRGLIIAGMALKVILLGGGIYVCLALFKLPPVYFVGGLGVGLGLLAAAGYVSRQ